MGRHRGDNQICWTSIMREKAYVLWASGKSYGEVAKTMGISRGSAASILRRMGCTGERPNKYNKWKQIGETQIVKHWNARGVKVR